MAKKSDLVALSKPASTAHLLGGLDRYVLPSAKRLGKRLGVGAYGTVELLEVNGMQCAGKTLHKSLLQTDGVGVQRVIERFIQECELMGKLRHPQIVQFLGVCFLPPDSSIPMLVMEYMQASLDDLLESMFNFPISLKRSMLQDVAQGLSFLHSHEPPVIHRDLTAKNILVNSEMQAKIADLGVARILDLRPCHLQSTLTRVPGTASYMPPEVFSSNTVYNSSIDIFSFGHLTLYTVSRVFPHLVAATYVMDDGQVMARTELERRADSMAQMKKQVGDTHPFIPLVTRCLSNRPQDRPTAKEVLQSLIDMKALIPDPYAKMTKFHLVQQLAKKEEELRQLEMELQKTREERERLHDVIAQLNTRIEEFTDAKSERRRSHRKATRDHGETGEAQKCEGAEKEESSVPEGSSQKSQNSLTGSVYYNLPMSPDRLSNRSSTGTRSPEEYVVPDFLPEGDHLSSDEDDLYEPAPDLNPSEPRPKMPFLTYIQLKPDVLFFLQNNSGGRINGVTYNLQNKSVRIERESMVEVNQSARRFQQVYRHVDKSPDFRVNTITVPNGVDSVWIEHIIVYLKEKMPRTSLAYIYLESKGALKLASISKPEYEHLKRFLPVALRNLTPINHVRPTHVPMYVHHMRNERRLVLKNSNLGSEDVNVIVNTTNPDLKFKGGLGGWLNDLSLGELQNQCNLYRRQQGPLEIGDVAIIGLPPGARGVLRCDWVINAVTPTTMYNEATFTRTLSRILRNVIQLAESKYAISIAMPPLSAGCMGVSRRLVASVLIGELLAYKNFRPNCLTDIRIVIPEEETYSILLHLLKQKVGKSATIPRSGPSDRCVGKQESGFFG